MQTRARLIIIKQLPHGPDQTRAPATSGDRYRAGANEESDERPRSRRNGESGRRLRQDCATAGDKMPGARRVHRVLFYSGGSTRSTEDSDVAVRHQHAVGTCADHDRGMVHRSSRDGITLERLACKDALAGRARRPAGETDGPRQAPESRMPPSRPHPPRFSSPTSTASASMTASLCSLPPWRPRVCDLCLSVSLSLACFISLARVSRSAPSVSLSLSPALAPCHGTSSERPVRSFHPDISTAPSKLFDREVP